MSKQSHTPGPWAVDRQVDGRGNARISVRGKPNSHPTLGPQVCQINEVTDLRYGGGNAHLIAAAPEMLKTLESAREALCALGGSDEAIELIDSVMAKARGES